MKTHLDKKVVVAILVIGGIIMAIEFMKSPERAQYRAPGTSEISLDATLQNQLQPDASCTNGNCTSTEPLVPDPLVNTPPAAAPVPEPPLRVLDKQKQYTRAQELVSPSGFLNLPAGVSSLRLAELVGKKVILVDFWTYSCINCQRTTPYLNAWYEKYKDQGLEIVGIHTPEFMFEKSRENVADAIARMGIAYPVVQDNDYGTWFAYGNRYWPRKYLVDIDGFVVYDHIGEGGYEETERQIQRALAERAEVLRIDQPIGTGTVQINTNAPSGGVASPETYFGALRNGTLANGKRGVSGEQTFTAPQTAQPNVLYLDGTWNVTGEYAEAKTANAKVVFRYRAKNAYFVASASAGVKVTVLRDGVPAPANIAGVDVQSGSVTVQADRLYHLISEPAPSEHTLELIIESPGLRAFTFTFG
jgi:thiol-disulfide isomerase/thioredoxin